MLAETRIELEFGLLGWVMTNPEAALAIDGLQASLFTDELLLAGYEAAIKKAASGEFISPATLVSAINITDEDSRKQATQVFLSCVSHALHVLSPREVVLSLSLDLQRQKLKELCDAVSAKCDSDIEGIAAVSNTLIDGVQDIIRESSGIMIRDSRAVTEEVMEALKEMPPCYSTGMPALDFAMDGGLYSGKAYGIAARKKVGKTIMCATISCNLDLAGIPHLFVCGEMSDKEIHERTLARLANVKPSVFRDRNQATPAVMQKISESSFKLTGAARYLNAPGITLDELKRAVTVAVNRHGIKGFILDYWQLVGGQEKGQSQALHLERVAQWIADFSRKHKIWALVMAQINQEGNTRGGEGIRLAFDQVYHLQPCYAGENDGGDITRPERWIQMLETRYTAWNNLGSDTSPRFIIKENGPYFEQLAA